MEQNNQNTAFLVMDMQAAMLGTFTGAASLIPKVASAISHAREKNIPVIYVVVGFRTGAPELSLRNKGLVAAKQRFASFDSAEWVKIHPELAPLSGEITVTKRRVSAFTGSDLEVVLRAKGIQHLILSGCSTSGVVLSTLREAADKDFQISVLSDACGDPDEEVHQVLTGKIFPRQAEVTTVDEWRRS
jgi:nicotinamidase-related amidase